MWLITSGGGGSGVTNRDHLLADLVLFLWKWQVLWLWWLFLLSLKSWLDIAAEFMNDPSIFNTPMVVCPAKPHINWNQGLVNTWHYDGGTNQCPTTRIVHWPKQWQPLAFINRCPSHPNKLIADEANPHSHCRAILWVNPTPTIPLFNNPLISLPTPKSPPKSCRNPQNIFNIHQTYMDEHHMIITVF